MDFDVKLSCDLAKEKLKFPVEIKDATISELKIRNMETRPGLKDKKNTTQWENQRDETGTHRLRKYNYSNPEQNQKSPQRKKPAATVMRRRDRRS